MICDLRDLRTLYINPNRYTHRFKNMYEQLEALGFKDFKKHNAFEYTDKHTFTNLIPMFQRLLLCGLSHVEILENTIIRDGLPVLILEDDCESSHLDFKYKHRFPDIADAYFLGHTSICNEFYTTVELPKNDSILRLTGHMWSAHAILYLNPFYASVFCHTIQNIITNVLDNKNLSHCYWDVVTAKLQIYSQFKIFASIKPQFCQKCPKFYHRCTSKDLIHKPSILKYGKWEKISGSS